MIKKLLPIVLLMIGTGAGVGAGIFMRPPPLDPEAQNGGQGIDESEALEKRDAKKDPNTPPPNKEYVKLNNQFVVPIVKEAKVQALVVIALSVEVPEGMQDLVFQKEPKLRDAFLQVLFDHANVGGFDGSFTDANVMAVLRNALKETAQKILGADKASDVLIIEIARQDY